MGQIELIRNGIIDKLMSISDKEYQNAILKLLDASEKGEKKLSLTEEQRSILKLSQQDLDNGEIISQKDLDKDDLEWLRKKMTVYLKYFPFTHHACSKPFLR